MRMRAILIALFGLFWQIDFSHSRAVNISNTWTLPQPGFNVFYRYFRDKISWFEADAVCQFHHSNLVTVENVEQFDATRGFLKQLDIADNVWIGLMRPSNADQFAWSNSKPLLVSEGFWAEPWALTEVPLCAVIDPAKDFRWHALRCGGPETAGFLCEMEVPDWAIQCTEQSDVTVQYISDSGNVQLSRHCHDFEKTLSCQGKMDKIAVFNELKCPEEEMKGEEEVTETTTMKEEIELTTTTPTSTAAITSTEETTKLSQTPVVIIPKVLTVEKLSFDDDEILHEINDNQLDAEMKHNDDLMMGDQAADVEIFSTSASPSPGAVGDEDKKFLLKQTMKKEVEPKKKNLKKMKGSVEDGEMMMGDAPAEATTDKIESSTTDRQRRDADETTLPIVTIEEINVSSTQPNDLSTTEETSTMTVNSIETTTEIPEFSSTPSSTTTTTEQPTTKIIVKGHPLFHSQTVFKEPIPLENPDPNLERKDVGNTDDHFVPPMLLVKTRFQAKASDADGELKETTTEIITDGFEFNITEITDDNTTDIIESVTAAENLKIDENSVALNETTASVATTIMPNEEDDAAKPIKVEKRNDPRLGLNSVKTTSKTPLTTAESLSTSMEPENASILTTEDTTALNITDTSEDDEGDEISSTFSSSTINNEEISSSTSTSAVDESSEGMAEKLIVTNEPATTQHQPTSELYTTEEGVRETFENVQTTTTATQPSALPKDEVEILSTVKNDETPLAKLIEISTERVSLTSTVTEKPKQPMTQFNNEINAHFENSHENTESEEAEDHHHIENNLNNADFQPYKPVRHRSFTKQDHHHGPALSIGRILG